jgi:hypothetical protein
MISGKNPSFDAGLVAGDGRNRRNPTKTPNCNRGELCFDPGFLGQIFKIQGHKGLEGKETLQWWPAARRLVAGKWGIAGRRRKPEGKREESGERRERKGWVSGFGNLPR